MEPEMAALASAASTAVVSLLATDAWTVAKAGLSELWRKVHPGGRTEAVEADLTEARHQLVAARAAGDLDVEQALVVEWQSRLRRLLAAHPGVAADLRRLLVQELAGERVTAAGSQTAVAMGGSVITQAGGDITIMGDQAHPSRRL